jgi:hypothetical protein
MSHEEKVQQFQEKIQALRDELKVHAPTTEDPKCAALCETSAEVMNGLANAFEHYLKRSEKAWQ